MVFKYTTHIIIFIFPISFFIITLLFLSIFIISSTFLHSHLSYLLLNFIIFMSYVFIQFYHPIFIYSLIYYFSYAFLEFLFFSRFHILIIYFYSLIGLSQLLIHTNLFNLRFINHRSYLYPLFYSISSFIFFVFILPIQNNS